MSAVNAPTLHILDLSKYDVTRPPRPMLAREADSVYWMSRYVERAEHIARLMRVKLNLLADSGDVEDALLDSLWQSVPRVFRLGDVTGVDPSGMAAKVAGMMTFSEENSNSLISCLTRARENARGVRETISAEMWEEINSAYWYIQSDDARTRFEESPDAFLKHVMTSSMLFQGLTDQTLRHDQRWHFIQLGKQLERIDYTCRVVAVHWQILTAAEDDLDTPIWNIHWMGLLRACCSLEAYRKANLGELDGIRVSAFLTLEKNFPRSVLNAVKCAYQSIVAVSGESDARKAGAAQKILGRLDAQLEYAEVGELMNEGVPQYLGKIESAVGDVALALQRGYFLH